jgi:hypothetical protein
MKLLLALILLIPLNAFAFEDMLQQFVDGYRAGDVSMLPLADDAKTRSGYVARDIYGDLFQSSIEPRDFGHLKKGWQNENSNSR